MQRSVEHMKLQLLEASLLTLFFCVRDISNSISAILPPAHKCGLSSDSSSMLPVVTDDDALRRQTWNGIRRRGLLRDVTGYVAFLEGVTHFSRIPMAASAAEDCPEERRPAAAAVA